MLVVKSLKKHHKFAEGRRWDFSIPNVCQIRSGLDLRPEFSSWTLDYIFAIITYRSQCYRIILGSLYSTNPNKGPSHKFRHWYICHAFLHGFSSCYLAQSQEMPGHQELFSQKVQGKWVQEAAVCDIHFLGGTKKKPWSILSATIDIANVIQIWSRS